MYAEEMDAALGALVAAVEGRPRGPSTHGVVTAFGASDRLAAWGAAAVDRVEPAADGAVTLAQWLTVPDGDGEPVRTRSEWRADAMVALDRYFLDHGDAGATSRGSRPDVTIVVPHDDLGRGAGRSLDGEPVDAATVRSLLCDAGVHRV